MKQVRPHTGNSADLEINYESTSIQVNNNGHTIQANVTEGGKVIFKNSEYRLVQFHFHTPSEHLINHLPYPMEMHMVNQDKDGRCWS
ncbi:carbonic anhydrase family protein [Pseudomonas sp. TH49]|uniref:carbonic anhydrase family protein n=1 Tax=Pseudomonas sp. TH49 TaxID=2796413 RepID=UPI00406CB527